VKQLRIISGGQTGVDRAGLDAAIKLGIPHGGWCPKGRKAEDGVIPAKYKLSEGPSPNYPWRTEANVIEADATLVYCHDSQASRGTALTVKYCSRHGRPCIDVLTTLALFDFPDLAYQEIAEQLVGFSTLNVAGPRESTNPGIYEAARERFEKIFECLLDLRGAIDGK
jgi:hypothetical protein